MSSPVVAAPVSVQSIFAVLSPLLDELRLERGSPVVADKSSDKKAQELEIILASFIHHVRHEIVSIRRQQNMLAPIHRLPVELLTDIFQTLVSEVYVSRTDSDIINIEDASPSQDKEPRPMKWDMKEVLSDTEYSVAVNLASVSSHWYHTIQSTPKLWSYLDTRHSLEVAEILLERSKQTPLHIMCSPDVNDEHEYQFMELVVPHLHRWKSFEAFPLDTGLLQDFDVEEYSAPLLERMILRRGMGGFTYDQLPSIILERSPNLRVLHVTPLMYPEELQVLSGLTNLSIRAMVGKKAFTMDQFELLFSASPKLETIFIWSNKMMTGKADLFSVTLPNLTSICLYHLDPRATIALLLSISPGSGRHTSVKTLGYWDLKWFNIVSQDPSRSSSLLNLTLRSVTWLSAACDSDEDNNFDPFEGVEEDECVLIQAGTESDSGCAVSLEIRTVMAGIEEVILALLRPDSGGTSILRNLELELGYYRDYTSVMMEMNLPHLEHLMITASHGWWKDGLQPLIEALARAYNSGTTSSPWWIFFDTSSKLKQLTLRGVDDLQPIIESVKARYRPLQDALFTQGSLKLLERLEVGWNNVTLVDHQQTMKEELELLLARMNIELDLVLFDDET